MTEVEIVYDGDCPFCSDINERRKWTGENVSLKLTDARSMCEEKYRDLLRLGYDLDREMIVIINGKRYVGGAALNKLSTISSGKTILGKGIDFLFSTSDRPGIYSGFASLRLLLLGMFGIGRIRDSHRQEPPSTS